MRICIIGEGAIATHVLQHCLAKGHEVLGVVANAAGFASFVQQAHPELNLIGPERDDWVDAVAALAPFDLLISALNLRRVPGRLLRQAEVAAVNFHDALLPRYAGLFAPQMAVASGEHEAGVTWHVMEVDWDTGGILAQKSVPIPANTSGWTADLLAAGCETFEAWLATMPDPRQQSLTERSYVTADTRPGHGALVCGPGDDARAVYQWFRSTEPDRDHVWGRLKCRAGGEWFEVLQMKAPSTGRPVIASDFIEVRRLEDNQRLTGPALGKLEDPRDHVDIAGMKQAFRASLAEERALKRACDHGQFSPMAFTATPAARLWLATAARDNRRAVEILVPRPGTHPLLAPTTRFAFPIDERKTLAELEEALEKAFARHLAAGPVPARLSDIECPDMPLATELAERWTGCPDQPWRTLPRLGVQEENALRAIEQGPVTPEPEDFIAAFWRQVAERPTAKAVEWADGTAWSYAELGDCVRGNLSQWAAQGRPVERTTILVRLPKGPEFLLAYLSILSAGGTVAAMHVDESPARIPDMVEASGAAWGLAEVGDGVFWHAPEDLRREQGTERWVASDLVCIFFTSGTTGPPKAVEVTRRGLSNHIGHIQTLTDFNPNSRVIITASPAFDGIFEEIFVTLGAGGTCVFPTPAALQSVRMLSRELLERQITILCCNTLLWAEWVQSTDFQVPPSLQTVNVGGSRLEVPVLRAWQEAGTDHIALFNGYGPTEASVTGTNHRVTGDCPEGVPIGRPESNVCIVILDATGRRVRQGETGEIHIGGIGLAAGYRQAPDKTAEKFVDWQGQRLYRTGDLGHWNSAGELMYSGRLDDQIKFRGYRLELSEVEAAVLSVPGVTLASVHHVPGSAGALDALVACIEGTGRPPRSAVNALLPSFLRPSSYLMLPAFPRTASAKVDRRALQQLAEEHMSLHLSDSEEATPEEIASTEIARVLGLPVDALDAGRCFRDHGGDSLAAMVAHTAIEQRLGRRLAIGFLHGSKTLAELPAWLASEESPQGAIRVVSRGRPDRPWLVAAHNVFGHPSLTNLWPECEGDLSICTMEFGPIQQSWLQAHPEADCAAYVAPFVAPLLDIVGDAEVIVVGGSLGGWLAWFLAEAFAASGGRVRAVVMSEPMFPGTDRALGPEKREEIRQQAAIVQPHLPTRLHRDLLKLKYLSHWRGRRFVQPIAKANNLPWDQSHPASRALRPLLANQALRPVPELSAVILTRAGRRGLATFWKELTPRIRFYELPVEAHHAFNYASHGWLIAALIRRTAR